MKALLCLDKSSDLLEAYSAIDSKKFSLVEIFYLENDRNHESTIISFIKGAFGEQFKIQLESFKLKKEFFKRISEHCLTLSNQDVFIAPFIRYRDLWSLTKKIRDGVLTIHLSECLPDSFGHIGYRVAFRGKSLISWLTLPFAKIYALRHKPDVCYYPLAPTICNPFVKQTFRPKIPPLIKEKRDILIKLFGSSNRTLFLEGFGYSVLKMSASLGENLYVATSKKKEIIVDGKHFLLPFHITAEEVILTGSINRIVGYPSTAMAWAKIIDDKIEILCHQSKKLSQIYGHLFSFFAKKSFSKIGIEINPEEPNFININY